MNNYVQLECRFGNNLWQLATAINRFGEGNFIAKYEGAPQFPAYARFFRNIQFRKRIKDEDKDNLSIFDNRDFAVLPNHPHINYLSGWFQDLFYIGDVDMRKYFIPTPIKTGHSFIHIRGGDYVTTGFNALIPESDWYKRAVEALKVPTESIRIITDDPRFAKKVLPDIPVFDCPDCIQAFRYLMGANSLVISASTFSWWAGYMGDSERVIFPNKWANDWFIDNKGILYDKAEFLD